MKKIIVMVSALLLVCAGANAQGFLEQLGKRAKDRVTTTAENKAENAVDRAVDTAFDKVEGLFKKKDKGEKQAPAEQAPEEQAAPAAQGGWTCPECGATGNTGKFCSSCGAKKPEGDGSWTCPECGKTGITGNFCPDCGAKKPGAGGAAASAPATVKNTAVTEYSKSDFVPGDEIFFEDLVEGEKVGEFPSKWDLIGGNCEIATLNGQQVIPFIDASTVITPLFDKNPKNYLPDVYTFEVDVWGTVFEEGANPDAAWYIFTFMNEDNGGVYEMSLHIYSNDSSFGGNWRNGSNGNNAENVVDAEQFVKRNDWNHLALSFNKRALKMYINGHRVVSAPNVTKAEWLEVSNQIWDTRGYMKNVRLAKGAVPLYDRLATDGKIITYAITFDTGKATLKPEADLEINRIKGILDQDPSLKFEVQGHCDSTGSAAVNDKLSQQRAEAIVARLVELGVSSSRLTAVGKGSNVPIADNSTDEGRAKNRRVEFIKK